MRGLKRAIKYGAVSVFALLWVAAPLWLLVVNSFKTEGEASRLGLGLPSEWAIAANYNAVFTDGNYATALRNSLTVAVPTIIVVLLLGSMAAWAYARSRSVSLKVCFYLTTLSILLPAAVIPTIFVLTTLQLDGSVAGYTLMMMGTRLGIVVFLTTGFIKALPLEIEEAAAIDGASQARTYVQILLPLLRPILFVGGVLLVISVWNDFFFGLLLLKTSQNATLTVAMFQFASASMTIIRWNEVFAHVVMSSLPLFIVYLFVQKHVLAGLTEGAIKG
jgi:raffinose/stachyose/melibiose transport system permease protein